MRHRIPASGQAMAEFVVALFAILLVAVGLLTVGRLVKADTDAMIEAQEDAVRGSLHSNLGVPFEADPSLASTRAIAGRAFPDDAEEVEGLPGGPLRSLSDGSAGAETFGMSKGSGSETVSVPALSRSLFEGDAEVTMEETVYMPQVSL